MTVIMAKVSLKDSSIPFDCAPVIRMVGAADAEQRAKVHGVEFEEETEEWGSLEAEEPEEVLGVSEEVSPELGSLLSL